MKLIKNKKNLRNILLTLGIVIGMIIFNSCSSVPKPSYIKVLQNNQTWIYGDTDDDIFGTQYYLNKVIKDGITYTGAEEVEQVYNYIDRNITYYFEYNSKSENYVQHITLNLDKVKPNTTPPIPVLTAEELATILRDKGFTKDFYGIAQKAYNLGNIEKEEYQTLTRYSQALYEVENQKDCLLTLAFISPDYTGIMAGEIATYCIKTFGSEDAWNKAVKEVEWQLSRSGDIQRELTDKEMAQMEKQIDYQLGEDVVNKIEKDNQDRYGDEVIDKDLAEALGAIVRALED